MSYSIDRRICQKIDRDVLNMKFCSKCGTQLVDEAVICIGCGCPVTPGPAVPVQTSVAVSEEKESGLTTAAKVFMILGTIVMGFYLIPLAWCIPMTVSYFNKVKRNQPIGTGFKVCSLLFVSIIGGILMLCDKNH